MLNNRTYSIRPPEMNPFLNWNTGIYPYKGLQMQLNTKCFTPVFIIGVKKLPDLLSTATALAIALIEYSLGPLLPQSLSSFLHFKNLPT